MTTQLPLVIDRFADFETPGLAVTRSDAPDTPYSIAGCALAAQIRETYDAPTALATFVVSVLDAAAGRFQLSLPLSVTSRLPAGQYPYDVMITLPGGRVEKIMAGTARVIGTATHS